MKKNNSVIDTLMLALMVALLLIGAHQTYVIGQAEGFRMGFFKSYYIFMLMLVLFVVYQMRKNKREKQEDLSIKGEHKTTNYKKDSRTGKKSG